MTFYIDFEHSIAVTAGDAHKYILYAICTLPVVYSKLCFWLWVGLISFHPGKTASWGWSLEYENCQPLKLCINNVITIFFFLNCIMDHKKMLPLSDSRSFLMGSKQAHDYNVWGNHSNVYKWSSSCFFQVCFFFAFHFLCTENFSFFENPESKLNKIFLCHLWTVTTPQLCRNQAQFHFLSFIGFPSWQLTEPSRWL